MVWNPSIPPIRDAANPLISHGDQAVYDSQVYDLNVIFDPLDNTKLIGYASAMTAPVANGTQSIVLFRATVANRRVWTYVGQVLSPTGTGTWDTDHCRFNCVVLNPDTSELYIYYAGWNGGTIKIGLAIAPYAHPETLTRYSGNPVLTVHGNGHDDGSTVPDVGDLVQTCSVIPPYISGKAYYIMDYEYRTGNPYLQNARIAHAADGKTWTKTGTGDLIPPKPDGQAYPNPEFHQVFTDGTTWFRIFESGTTTFPFALYGLQSNDPEGPWVPISDAVLLLGPSGISGAYDEAQLATGFMFLVDGVWELYFCGTDTTNFSLGRWSIGVATYNAVLVTVGQDSFTSADGTALTDPGHIPEVGTWVAVDGTFDIQSGKAHTDSDNNNDSVVMYVGASDVIITYNVVPRGDGGGQDSPGLIQRQSDSTHNDFNHFSAASQTFDLYENTGSGAGLKLTQSTTIVDNTSYAIKIVCIGACYVGYKDGAEVFVDTACIDNSQGQGFGPRLAKAGLTAGRRCSWDNFLIQKFVASSVSATTYTLSGPSVGAVGVASSNFTVTPDADATGVVVTPHSSGNGYFTPTSITFSGTMPATFTYSPLQSKGSPHHISVTNDGALADPAALNYTVILNQQYVQGQFSGYDQANQWRAYRESVAASIALTDTLGTTAVLQYANAVHGTVFVRAANTLMTLLTYYASNEFSGTYLPLYSGATAVTQTVEAGKCYDLPSACQGARFLKIVADVGGTVDVSIKG